MEGLKEKYWEYLSLGIKANALIRVPLLILIINKYSASDKEKVHSVLVSCSSEMIYAIKSNRVLQFKRHFQYMLRLKKAQTR